MSETFRALLAEGDSKNYTVEFRDLPLSALPAGDVLIDVQYSSLNYKDGLAVTAKGKIIRKFPMVCGIDVAGRVLESSSPEFRPRDEVVAVGQNMSETVWGGYSQRARLSADALVHLPQGLTLHRAMAIGTAGFTAMLAVLALEHNGVKPGEREVIVTGAAGGVGSVAVTLLAGRGYKVAASTGRPELHSYLRELGATSIVDRAELYQKTPPLGPERWAGGVDNVGGQTLANVLATTAAFGAVAACGLASGSDLPATVLPFILRGVSLLGINSVLPPKDVRVRAWQQIAKELPLEKLDAMTSTEPLSKIKHLAEQILAGQVRGRVVLDVNA